MIYHGSDGWILEDMDWNPETGVSTFTYERMFDGKRERFVTDRAQPTNPEHQDWDPFFKQGILAIGRVFR